jgi:hypothetical protein
MLLNNFWKKKCEIELVLKVEKDLIFLLIISVILFVRQEQVNFNQLITHKTPVYSLDELTKILNFLKSIKKSVLQNLQLRIMTSNNSQISSILCKKKIMI